MRPLHPFVVGHLLGAVVIGIVAGAMLGVPAAFAGAAGMAVGATVSCLVCWAWPGLGAKARFLWPIAVLANPVMLLALAMIVVDWDCLTGERTGWDCMAVAVAVIVAGLCLLPPFGGLLWRRWKGQRLI